MTEPQLNPVPAAAQLLLSRLIACALLQDEGEAREARRGALEAHGELLRLAPDGPELQAHLDGLWARAIEAAETPDLLARSLEVSPSLPKTCPLAASDLLQPGLALARLEQTIRSCAGTG